MPDETPTAPQGSRGFPPPNADGTPALVGPDEYTRELMRLRADRPNIQTVTGNYADIQRLGASLAANSTEDIAGVHIGSPPGVDVTDENVVSPAQADALNGIYTVEAEREGTLKPAPPMESRNADPAPEKEEAPKAQTAPPKTQPTPPKR